MKKQYMYLIVVLVVLVAAVLGMFYFTSIGKMICGPCGCPGAYTCGGQIITCLSGWTPYACSYGTLYCKSNTANQTQYYRCPNGLTGSCSVNMLIC